MSYGGDENDENGNVNDGHDVLLSLEVLTFLDLFHVERLKKFFLYLTNILEYYDCLIDNLSSV